MKPNGRRAPFTADLRRQRSPASEEAAMSFTIGDRVVYHGWRGDTGEGTVIAIRPNWIRVKRDFSADDGVWFRPSELTIKAKRPA